MYSRESEARFDVGCAKEDRLVREGDPCVVYVYEDLHLGHTECDGCFVGCGVTWFMTMLVGKRVDDASPQRRSFYPGLITRV